MNFIILPPGFSRENFIQLVVEHFPTLKSEILGESREGLIHSQVSCLADYANACLKNSQLAEFKKVVDFFQQIVRKADSLTEDALYLNFLGGLEMHGDASVYQAARGLFEPDYLVFWAKWRAKYFGEKPS